MVPLSSLTLFFSEVITDPCAVFCAFGSNVRFGIPITPWVLALIGGRALLALLSSVPSVGLA